ncbi:Sb-PDE family phosphodiesterase [Luteolibacter flavescens]|uniref:Sb-PDE family phosphodiesterase n=1 Tax=Luteolibacter flavescens TaxID=1859460 RepID=A0ABT3FJY8_9BACT|nr:Sb-PDE family phosphodiesterase [Luteolibacter flavescens]MCW1883886.1 Sb-PDE family phosphodiesterase [Luteolibacter flavescens]
MSNRIAAILIAALSISLPHIATAAEEGIIRLEGDRIQKERKHLRIPAVNGMQAIKCDFHMHTVFTDGHVWPNVRVQEAWRDGLDAFAFTEHAEYAPYQADVKRDPGRSYELAKGGAAEHNLTLVKGIEITRNTPPGHFNAIFIKDASKFPADRKEELDQVSVDEAIAQDAFLFWNHPGWKAKEIPGSYEWIPFVEKLHQEKKLHGIEVANGHGIHTKAIDWALERNLTIIGNTDVHNLISHEYKGHRTMTLVFAKDRSAEAIREALVAGRTVAWAGKYLIGREDNAKGLFEAAVKVAPVHHEATDRNNAKRKFREVTNDSDLVFEMKARGLPKIVLNPGSTQLVSFPAEWTEVEWQVTNVFVGTEKRLKVKVSLP